MNTSASLQDQLCIAAPTCVSHSSKHRAVEGRSALRSTTDCALPGLEPNPTEQDRSLTLDIIRVTFQRDQCQRFWLIMKGVSR